VSTGSDEGTLLLDARQTLADFLRRWLSDVAKPSVRSRTYVTYESAVTNHIEPHLAAFDLRV